MNVAQLIELLKRAPQDAKVITEGCDCIGECDGIEVDKDGDLMLTRPDGVDSEGRERRNGWVRCIDCRRWMTDADKVDGKWRTIDGEPACEACRAAELPTVSLDVEFPSGVVAVDKDGKVIE